MSRLQRQIDAGNAKGTCGKVSGEQLMGRKFLQVAGLWRPRARIV